MAESAAAARPESISPSRFAGLQLVAGGLLRQLLLGLEPELHVPAFGLTRLAPKGTGTVADLLVAERLSWALFLVGAACCVRRMRPL